MGDPETPAPEGCACSAKKTSSAFVPLSPIRAGTGEKKKKKGKGKREGKELGKDNGTTQQWKTEGWMRTRRRIRDEKDKTMDEEEVSVGGEWEVE